YLDAYMRDLDRAEQRANWVDLEAAVKYAEMQPLPYRDLDEAVSEVMADKAKCGEILKAFAGTDDAALGAAMRAAVKAYWLDYCTQRAEGDY
ncbi:MAG TPA: hypothetical protein DD502_33750, partial [Cupriavidus sp.]|nr:hypothetical protein [Cupriavidus sp.]